MHIKVRNKLELLEEIRPHVRPQTFSEIERYSTKELQEKFDAAKTVDKFRHYYGIFGDIDPTKNARKKQAKKHHVGFGNKQNSSLIISSDTQTQHAATESKHQSKSSDILKPTSVSFLREEAIDLWWSEETMFSVSLFREL